MQYYILLLFYILVESLIRVNGGLDYEIWCVGICDADIITESVPGALLMGGSVSNPNSFLYQL